MVRKHTIDELKVKIHQIYPKIDQYGVAATVIFDKAKRTYVLELKKGLHHLATCIGKTDADRCMGGVECLHLGCRSGSFWKTSKRCDNKL